MSWRRKRAAESVAAHGRLLLSPMMMTGVVASFNKFLPVGGLRVRCWMIS